MLVNESRTAAVFSRRRVLSWAAGAAATGAMLRVPSVFAVAAQESATVFLDSTVVHDIAISFDQAAYDAMIETFKESGDKEWIVATVVIDGSTYENAAMRLKGNSSLGGLGGGPEGGPTDFFLGEDGTPVSDMPDGAVVIEGTPDVDGPIMRVVGGGGGGGASAEEPERLPWLIRLDKNVDEQNHNGLKELVIRSNHSAAALNEVVSLELLELAGLASEKSAATRFSVNGGTTALRLAIEHPNDEWMAAHFSADGLLFKGEAGGDYSYRGDDPALYNDIFDLEAGGTKDDAEDFKPLFSFLDFLNNTDDATFNAELPNRLDVDKFAVYQAMMDLIENGDNISGPGNNAYLYVGPDSEQFTVVPWDMNLSFQGFGMFEEGEDGEGMRRPVRIPEGTDSASGTPEAGSDEPVTIHAGPSMVPNILVTRSDTFPGFTDLVASETVRLRTELFASGKAAEILSRRVELLRSEASDLIDDETLASESDAIAKYFTE
jgi:spore coat protein CotH